MEEQIVELTFGVCYPGMLEDDDELLLEPGDGIESFKFPGTDEMDPEKLSSWVERRVLCELDGDLDDPEVFENILIHGIAKFGTNDAHYDDDRGLVLNDINVYLKVTPAQDQELTEEVLDDLFHAVVIKVNESPFIMSFTEFEDYGALVVDRIPSELVPIEDLDSSA